MESKIFRGSILVATFKCLNNTNRWADRTSILIFFIFLLISYVLLCGKCLNTTNQWTDGALWFAYFFLFRDLFRNSIFQRILVAPLLTLGTLGPPSGSLLAPLDSLWAPLAPFWLPLVPFGSLLAPCSRRLILFL